MSRSKHSPSLPVTAPDADPEGEYRPPSKSQLKRQMSALQDLGERLVGLPDSKLRQLPLAERLYDAIREAQRITAHEGRRRQLQYVGKLMRDAQVEPIQALLSEWDGESMEQIAAFHQLELWRDRLLASDEHFTAFMDQYPHAEAQPLRALIRSARKEQATNAALLPGHEPQRKNYRALFQEIKRLQAGAHAEPPAADDDDKL